MNLFRLFEDQPEWREAEAKIKAACISAAQQISAIQEEYEDCGATDTDSRDAITSYIWNLLMSLGCHRDPGEAVSDVEDGIRAQRSIEDRMHKGGSLERVIYKVNEVQSQLKLIVDCLQDGRIKNREELETA
jgi:hypothetical protein